MSALQELFTDQLKDIYYAEKQIYKTLPKMMRKASSTNLKSAFEKHRQETEGQIERLDKVFELVGIPSKAKKCPAIDGILDEGAELLEEHEVGAGLDAAMAAAAQAVEHYEMARYGTLIAWADQLGMSDASSLLQATLAEEKSTDAALSKLGKSELNKMAANSGDESDDTSARSMPRAKKKA